MDVDVIHVSYVQLPIADISELVPITIVQLARIFRVAQ
jgi:hypothetical protein